MAAHHRAYTPSHNARQTRGYRTPTAPAELNLRERGGMGTPSTPGAELADKGMYPARSAWQPAKHASAALYIIHIGHYCIAPM